MFDIPAFALRNAKLSLLDNPQIGRHKKDEAFHEIEKQAREREAKTAKLRALRIANAAEITAAAVLGESGRSIGKVAGRAGRPVKGAPRNSLNSKPFASEGK